MPATSRSGQAEQATGESDAAGAGADLPAQHAEDALRKRAAVCGHRQSGRASPFFHKSEGASVLDGIAAQKNGYIVTAVLAFSADALVQPPDGGVVEEQSLN